MSAPILVVQHETICPPGWVGEPHPSPIRMWIFVLQGQMRFEASNGEVRDIAAGDGLRLEDTSGVGHSQDLNFGSVVNMLK